MSGHEGRRYQVIRLLGKGGFGKVYQARLEDDTGFSKEVAIKLLNDRDAPVSVLQRFRDESRILGLIRDRAVISVDAPTRLEGRWAVVMEYVEGVTTGRLVSKGAIPPKVSLEIIQEVARALAKLYEIPGPDGQPICLVHRDLKPANIQVTAGGDIKILDFGIARAQFAQRESLTTMHVIGTYGFIAPERMRGEEVPAGDIFSLGVVLRVFLSGQRMSQKRAIDLSEITHPDTLRALRLAEDMCQEDPERRPTASEVESRAAALAADMEGLTLRDWARRAVPASVRYRDDELVGQVLNETMERPVVETGEGSDSRLSRRHVVGLATLSGLLVVGALLIGLFGGGALVAGVRFALPETPEADALVAPEGEPAPVNLDAASEVVDPAPPEVLEEAPPSEPIASAPQPSPVQRAASPPPARTYEVTLSSIPMGAEVFLNGKSLGHTPLLGVALPEGEHHLRMRLDEEEGERQVTISRRGATRFIWTVGDGWQVRY